MYTYQIFFHFLQSVSDTPWQVELLIDDDSSFAINDKQSAQVQPYLSVNTPPLLNASISSKRLFFNVPAGSPANQGVQMTVFTAVSGSSLTVNLTNLPGTVTAGYGVVGQPYYGPLQPGVNVIPLGS